MNYTDQLMLQQGEIIFFNEGKLDNNEDYYLYIAVSGTKIKEYFSAINASVAPTLKEFEKLGSVIAFGNGKPSSALKNELAEKYGVYHP